MLRYGVLIGASSATLIVVESVYRGLWVGIRRASSSSGSAGSSFIWFNVMDFRAPK